MWQKNDPANALQQKRPFGAVFLPLRRVCKQSKRCTAHSISADNVEALILSAVKRLSRFVLNDEEAFAKELQALWNEKQIEKPKQNKSELHRFQKRYDELSKLIRGLYENLVSGLLPERQYKQLMKQYDDEQAELETKIEEMKRNLPKKRQIRWILSISFL